MQPIVLVAVMLLLASCAGGRAYRQGMDLTEKGQIEAGLEKLEQATKEAPDNMRYRVALVNLRLKTINELLLSADANVEESRLAEAEIQYTRVLKLDKDNVRAKAGLKRVTHARQHIELMISAKADFDTGDFASVAEKTRAVLLVNPKQRDALALRSKVESTKAKNKFTPPTLNKYNNPLTLEFRDAPVKMVFDVLSSTTGVNFILDKDLRPEQRVSIFVKQVTFDKALSMLLESNQLDRKIINENTVVVYPRTPQKSQEYEELVVKTFYLANADPKQTSNMLRTILKVKDIFVDDRLNMMVVRDTPETILLAEKLIAAQDLPEPEVLLDVTVIEIKRGRLIDLGIQPPTQLGLLPPTTLDSNNDIVVLSETLRSIQNISQNRISVGGTPSVKFNEDFSDLNVLANPRIRVRNREKAKIHVGDRIPVITTTTAANATSSTSETVQYVDVGIKLEVEPNIYLEGDVSIKIALEVSALGPATVTNNGSLVYQIGTRNTSTLLRLKDGETQLLAGLINDEDRTSINGLPGLAELPLVGRLFSSHQDDRKKTEVILSITPHIVRNIELPTAGDIQFWSGTATGGQGAYTDAFMSQGGMRGPPSRFEPPFRPQMPEQPQVPEPQVPEPQIPEPQVTEPQVSEPAPVEEPVPVEEPQPAEPEPQAEPEQFPMLGEEPVAPDVEGAEGEPPPQQ